MSSKEPASRQHSPKKKIKPEQLLFIIFAFLMVIAIAGMMFIERLGEEKMGDASRIHDAADR